MPFADTNYDTYFTKFSDLTAFLDKALYLAGGDSPSFPPYDVQINETTSAARITLAVAGYSPNDITVSLTGGRLVIDGAAPKVDEGGWTTSRRGISKRDFRLKFNVNQTYEVADATYDSGLLTITLVPTEVEKKQIPITVK